MSVLTFAHCHTQYSSTVTPYQKRKGIEEKKEVKEENIKSNHQKQILQVDASKKKILC